MKIRPLFLLAAALCTVGFAVAPLLTRGDDRQPIRYLNRSSIVPHSRPSDSGQPQLVDSLEIARLRALGPQGLAEILKQYDQSQDPRLLPAIDAVAGQKDAVTSRLYWYTDLPSAMSAAKRENKPILYVRLLGKLTDEYSCANSRFFRAVLYPDPAVANLLSGNFILVWQSERPVPVVTIDFGDGRQLKRTLTGNSIHYVLNSDGNVVDALPGLYSPQAFVAALHDEFENEVLADPHTHQTAQIDAFAREFNRSGLSVDLAAVNANGNANLVADPGKANAAAPRAMERAVSKSAGGERRLLEALTPQFRQQMAVVIKQDNPQIWKALASNYQTQLSPQSIELIKSQMGAAAFSSERLDRTVQNLQQSVSLDTARNQFLFRRQILSWLAESKQPIDVETLNQRVYSELFLTPRSDAWLGLLPDATYTGLYADGVVMAK